MRMQMAGVRRISQRSRLDWSHADDGDHCARYYDVLFRITDAYVVYFLTPNSCDVYAYAEYVDS